MERDKKRTKKKGQTLIDLAHALGFNEKA